MNAASVFSERLATMPRLERASVTLADAAKALLRVLDDGGAWPDVTAAWSAVEQSSRARMCWARSP